MAQILVDLNTRIITPEAEVFVARPGKGFKLYPTFISEEVVGPDLPGLGLVIGRPLSEHKNLDQLIRRSRALRSWYLGKRQSDEPSRSLADYTDAPGDKRVLSLRTVLSGYFEKLNVGDLVIVPPSAYSQPAYIGEVITSPTDYSHVKVPSVYGQDRLTVRGVKWLAQVEKRRLPDTILTALDHPISIYLLARSQRKTIYGAAFGTYVDFSLKHPDYIARFSVTEAKFTTSSDVLLQAFFNFVASNQRAVETGQASRGFYEAVFEDLGAYAPDLRTNVNSPGFLALISERSIPLVAAVMFALATQVGDVATSAAQTGKIVIGNSKAPANDPCTAAVAQSSLALLKLLKLTEWPKACEMARLAEEKTGITGSVTVEQAP